MIKALLFDFDGLILDTETPEALVWQEIYADHGVVFPVQEWGQIVGGSGAGAFDPASHLEALVGYPLDPNELTSFHRQRSGSCTGTILVTWTFYYDGDGNRVKQYYLETGATGVTTYYFFGGAYEVQVVGSSTTTRKYYAFGGQTVAMHDGTSLVNFLTDHLGSVVAVLDTDGDILSEQRYLPFGQVRTDVGTITQTDYGYTGQRNLDAQQNSYSLGLMDYKARFYDFYLNRFIQPDSLVPSLANPQSLNRYAYVLNNPIRYNDPRGHEACSEDGFCFGKKYSKQPLAKFISGSGGDLTQGEKNSIEQQFGTAAQAYASTMNSIMLQKWLAGKTTSFSAVISEEAFYQVHGGSVSVQRANNSCASVYKDAVCWAAANSGENSITIYTDASVANITDTKLMTHELGHIFFGNIGTPGVPEGLIRPLEADGSSIAHFGTTLEGSPTFYGYAGRNNWQYGRDPDNRQSEELADMFIGWVYGQWENSVLGTGRSNFISRTMRGLLASTIP